MGTQVSKPKTLLSDKFKVLVKTNINLSKKGKYITNIKNTIEGMSSAFRDSISHYLNIKSIKITNLKPFSFELECVLNKNGKKNVKPIKGVKLKKDEMNNLLTFENLEEHIITSLNEASYRSDPFIIGDKEFVIKKNNINTIKLITK